MVTPFGKIFILGASGFIGKNICNSLIKGGFTRDKLICLSPPELDLTNVESIGNLSCRIPKESILVITSGIKRQIGDSLESFHKNMLMAISLCKIIETKRVSKIVYFSSASVYGENQQRAPLSESSPPLPSSYYGISKLCSENIILKSAQENGVKSTIIIRPSLVYGVGDRSLAYGPSGFLAAAMERRPLVLWGDGKELRDFVYIDDVGRVLSYVLKSQTSGILNLVSGKSYSYLDVISLLQGHFPGMVFTSRPRTKPKIDQTFRPSKILEIVPPTFKFTSLESGIYSMVNNLPPENS